MKTETEPLALVPSYHPALWTKAEAVTNFAEQVLPHVEEMRTLMLTSGGVGLAAPQVGIGLRFFITSLSGLEVVINPVITVRSAFRVSRSEGCLSFGGGKRHTFVARQTWIKAEWYDHKGGFCSSILQDLGARVFQHETDHLDGICIFPNT